MSDAEIIDYVKTEYSKGTSQEQIASNLIKKGVSKSQLERIKTQQNTNKKNTTSSLLKDTISAKYTSNPLRKNVDSNTLNIQDIQIEDILGLEKSEKETPKIFGHNIFNNTNLTFDPVLNIPTPANYRLGPGDEVVIDVWGASQTSINEVISPEGSIKVDYLGPIYLNGMTVNEANTYVRNKLATVYGGLNQEGNPSQIKLSLGQIRTIQVNVMGEVVSPGTYSLSSLSSIFHALYKSGGVNDIGSLRNIKLYRQGKLVETFDIYEYILNGKISKDIRLSDGDVIIVPPYEALVTITGSIKRPMIYEMLPTESLNTLVEYSGGFAAGAYTDKLDLSRQSGFEKGMFTVDKNSLKSFPLQDGDSVSVKTGFDLYENRIEIKGAVFRPGYYELGKKINTVKDLIIAADGIKGDAFLDRAILTRQKDDFTHENLALNIQEVLNDKKNDLLLRKNDVLYIPAISDLKSFGDFVIHGQVSRPGNYDYADNTTLEDLIVQAGGLLESASTVRVDIARRIINPTATSQTTTLSDLYSFRLKDGLIVDGQPGFILQPYDQVYVRKSPGYHEQENIIIQGEVLYPGTYALNKKAERLSDLIRRSGSITTDAYTKGARLLRKRDSDEKARLATLMRLSARNTNSKDSIDVSSLDRDSVYAVGIELDKALLNPGSSYDLVLKSGDQIIIPEYNNTVKIHGAVMYPNTIVFQPGEKISYYINQAGGYADNAKKSKSFVIYMNGTITKAKKSDKNLIQPGSEIVVPTKEQSRRLSIPEMIGIGSSITSMASVVALLINNLNK